jgi:hypothetical protein
MDGTCNKSNQTGRKLGGNIFRKFNMYLLFDCYYQCLNATFTIIIDIVLACFVFGGINHGHFAIKALIDLIYCTRRVSGIIITRHSHSKENGKS